MKKEKKVKVVINTQQKHSGCPQGQLRKDKGTPGPNC